MKMVLIMIRGDWYNHDNHNDHTYNKRMLITQSGTIRESGRHKPSKNLIFIICAEKDKIRKHKSMSFCCKNPYALSMGK